LPEISRFFGIILAMYYNDHEPPHFHARYAGKEALVEIETLSIMDGRLPPRVLGLLVRGPRCIVASCSTTGVRRGHKHPSAK
jgi:hypothetical protein